MKRKSLVIMLAFVFAMGMILVGCGGNSAQETTTNTSTSGGNNKTEGSKQSSGTESESVEALELNFGHTLAPDSHYHAYAEKFAELAAEKSGGKIKINLFPQSQLGGEVKMIQAARTGTQDFLITAQAPLTNTIKEYALFDLPYLFDSVDQANEVLQGEVGDKFLDMLPAHDLVGFGWVSAMERNVFASKPVNTVQDLQGFKIRVMQAPGYVKAYEALGAQPTPMAYSEVYLSLQQGVVDGGDTSPDQFIMDKFIEVADYYNLTHVHYLPALVIGSKAKWESFSAKQQEILQEAMDGATQYAIDYYKQSYADSIKQMKEAGVKVVETDVSTLKQESEKVYESLLSEIPNGQQLFDAVKEAKNK
jgi:tripartite ATP-independent transporter DctP family solute receptor